MTKFAAFFIAWSYVVLVILGIAGWVLNILAIIALASAGEPLSTMFVLRCIGVVIAPLGAMFGWIL